MTDVTFRAATASDAAALSAIYNFYVETSTVTFDLDSWSVDDMIHKIDSVEALGMPFIVAELDGDIVGYGYLSTWREKCAYETTMENTLYLREDSRGLGIGGRLLDVYGLGSVKSSRLSPTQPMRPPRLAFTNETVSCALEKCPTWETSSTGGSGLSCFRNLSRNTASLRYGVFHSRWRLRFALSTVKYPPNPRRHNDVEI